jgi:glycosyltransferase involved in cell wall biosynthesis
MSGLRNVLFIVYYFPPMGSSGVQRPLKFIKYLQDYGWNPIVLAPHPGAYHTFDQSLQEELDSLDVEVHRVDAKTPFHYLGKSHQTVNFIPDRFARLGRSVSSFFWLPDNKTGWIAPAVQKGEEIIQNTKIDLIFSTAPPYSNHLIAVKLKKKYQLPVILDFRDDWLESHLITYPTRYHKKKMARIEHECLKYSDAVTVLNDKMIESFSSRTDNDKPIYLIEQGFDPDDFDYKRRESTNEISPVKLRFLYNGIFYGDNQPDPFLKALDMALQEKDEMKEEIELMFQGGLEQRHLQLINELGLKNLTHNLGFIPHRESIDNLLKADILWLIVGMKKNYEYVTTGKFFEYITTAKPILGLAKKGVLTKYLENYKAGYIAHPEKPDAIKKVIFEIYTDWKENRLPIPDEEFIHHFNRKKITEKLAKVFTEHANCSDV